MDNTVLVQAFSFFLRVHYASHGNRDHASTRGYIELEAGDRDDSGESHAEYEVDELNDSGENDDS